MPIHRDTGGFKWGEHGKVYPTRDEAEKQARAAYANGYEGKAEGGEVTNEMNELHKKIIKDLLDKEASGASQDLIESILNHGKSDEHEPVEVSEEEVVPAEGEDDDDEAKKIAEAFLKRRK
jgi:hypothetical protein